MIGEVEIEEDCIANLLRQKGGLYIEAYGRVGLRIGPDVRRDLAIRKSNSSPFATTS